MALTVIAMKTLCGFCSTGNHALCPIGVVMRRHAHYPEGVVWVCACQAPECADKEYRCTECGNQREGEVDSNFLCIDAVACQDTVTVRRDNDPFIAKIREAREMAKVTETAKKTTAKKTAAPKTGTCVCGCKGTTKGGKFLPGHDARFVSGLVGTAEEANFTKTSLDAGRKALKDVGASDALQAKFEKSAGLAVERRDKKAAAAKEKADAKEKAKADSK